ncbi:MBL fold metallo-hydrolase [Rhodococcus daqingensis]|uniref:Rhodanese-like domain-containing protein n=1 Tax=Rhodococcus daqingensis TaxID=2479363 RepID=A0ABW2RTB5_9NOCA
MSEIEIIRTASLSDNSYLLIAGDEAALVDPQRDCWRLLQACARRRLALRYVLETHVHNDYVSGAMEVRAATGARIVAPARGRYCFDHLPVDEGDEIDLGGLTLLAMATPGHTPEHTAYRILEPARAGPGAVFTGGSLMVGGAGRTDLLGDEFTADLTRAQFASVHRLCALPDDTRVLPTHGAGSFCSAACSDLTLTSTIGHERVSNPAVRAADELTFVRERLSGLPPYPAYYPHMAPINRAGATVLGTLPCPPRLSAGAVSRLAAGGAWVVDGRDRKSFADGHLPGSLNIELDDGFASYVGRAVPFGARLLLVLPEPVAESVPEAVSQLLRIGYDEVAGILDGGVESWHDAGLPLRRYPVASAVELAERDGDVRVLDVRTETEDTDGHIDGSLHVFVGDLPQRMSSIPRDRRVWTICASGRRAALAASLLDRDGIPVTAVTRGGVTDALDAIARSTLDNARRSEQ